MKATTQMDKTREPHRTRFMKTSESRRDRLSQLNTEYDMDMDKVTYRRTLTGVSMRALGK